MNRTQQYPDWRTVTFFDTETLPSETPPTLEDIEPPANYSKPETIEKYRLEKQQELWEKQALVSHEGRICCAGWCKGVDAVKVVSGAEADCVTALNTAMSFGSFFVGFNIGFDLLFASHAALRHGLRIDRMLKSEPKWERNYACCMEMMGFGFQYGFKISLSNACKLLGLPAPIGKGEEVFGWHREGRYDLIEQHCASDIEAVRSVYKKLTS